MASLGELDFSDLYICLDQKIQSRYAPTRRPGQSKRQNLPVPPDYDETIDLVRTQVIRQEHDIFALDLDSMRVRGSRREMFDQKWVALRKLPLDPLKLDQLGFRPEVISQFRAWSNRTGLIVVGGPTGSGKTTTAVAILDDMLERDGDVAITIEDPIEYFMQGPHGQAGYCWQSPVIHDEDWGEAVKAALRWAPRYIFLGEIRTPEAVKWLLRAATSGHLAICTVHGGSPSETLGAILQMAQKELGDTAANVLADGICGVVQQSVVGGRRDAQLLTTDASPGDPVRVAIRKGTLEQLGTTLHQQDILRKKGVIGTVGSVADDEDDEDDGGQRQRVAPPQQRAATPRPATAGTVPGPSSKVGAAPRQQAPAPVKKGRLWGLF